MEPRNIIFPSWKYAVIVLLIVCCLKLTNSESNCRQSVTHLARVRCVDELKLDELELYNITFHSPEVCEERCAKDAQCRSLYSSTVERTCALYRPKVTTNTTSDDGVNLKYHLRYEGKDGCASVPETECYRLDGSKRIYRGRKMTTETGVRCQRWDTNTPQSVYFTNPALYSVTSLTEVEDFCRIPDVNSDPWCYTTKPSVRWEYCGIPRCLDTGI